MKLSKALQLAKETLDLKGIEGMSLLEEHLFCEIEKQYLMYEREYVCVKDDINRRLNDELFELTFINLSHEIIDKYLNRHKSF